MTIYSIYKITNLINNKTYIGYTSKSIESRLYMHRASSKSGRDDHIKLYRAFKKYGDNNFIIECIFQSKDKNYLVKEMEQFFINEYNSMNDRFGYNMCVGGQGGNIKSKEALLRDSIRYSGENNPMNIIKRQEPDRYKQLCDKRDAQRNERYSSGTDVRKIKVYVIRHLGIDFYIKEARNLQLFCKLHKIPNPINSRKHRKLQKSFIKHITYKVMAKDKANINYKNYIKDQSLFINNVVEITEEKLIYKYSCGGILFTSIIECGKYFNISRSIASNRINCKGKRWANWFRI